MSSKLEELRKRLQDKQNKTNIADNAIYAFWNIPENIFAELRFLPDGGTNDYFWAERQMIKLPFSGIVDGDSKPIFVTVPCMEMWDETCPVLTEIRPWFKDSSLEDLARKYWKKRSYIFQGFVRVNPMTNDELPENPIRRFVINPSIFDIIKEGLMDVDLQELPTDYLAGYDFKIKRTKPGEYSNYNLSKYSPTSSSLTDEENDAINQYGLFTLTDFLPKKPNQDGVNAIREMFEASVDGEKYDPSRWSSFYRPPGVDASSSSSTKSETVLASASTDTKEETSSVVTSTTTENVTEVKKNPADILATIKARAAAQKEE